MLLKLTLMRCHSFRCNKFIKFVRWSRLIHCHHSMILISIIETFFGCICDSGISAICCCSIKSSIVIHIFIWMLLKLTLMRCHSFRCNKFIKFVRWSRLIHCHHSMILISIIETFFGCICDFRSDGISITLFIILLLLAIRITLLMFLLIMIHTIIVIVIKHKSGSLYSSMIFFSWYVIKHYIRMFIMYRMKSNPLFNRCFESC
mmetsp:Transcript_29962/g.34812  ORF Transcript_29962/g.34812 Transcript_29962/m.34812 type:complete len:204 (-) Transcript_29962:277-888(-)